VTTALLIIDVQHGLCTDATVGGALALGCDVVLVGDTHSTMDNGGLSAERIIADHNATFVHMKRSGARVKVAGADDVII
jgi:nicotinamidase-related amidase